MDSYIDNASISDGSDVYFPNHPENDFDKRKVVAYVMLMVVFAIAFIFTIEDLPVLAVGCLLCACVFLALYVHEFGKLRKAAEYQPFVRQYFVV